MVLRFPIVSFSSVHFFLMGTHTTSIQQNENGNFYVMPTVTCV